VAYVEQVGWKRHVGPNRGEIHLRYRAMTSSRAAARRSEIPRRKAGRGSGLEPTGGFPKKNAAQLRFRMLKAQSVRAGPHDYDDVGAWLQLCTMQSKKLSDEAFCPVPLNSSPDLATRRNSEAGLAGRAGALEHQEMPTRLAASSALDSEEILARTDATRPCQSKIRPTCVRPWGASIRPDACDPWHDASSAPGGHPEWPCEHGNHGGDAAGDCWADRFSSRQ